MTTLILILIAAIIGFGVGWFARGMKISDDEAFFAKQRKEALKIIENSEAPKGG